MLDDILKKYSNVLFLKGTVNKPLCPFAVKAIDILKKYDFNVHYVDVTKNIDLKNELIKKSNIATTPLLFVNNTLIGDSQKISSLDSLKKLQDILK